MLLHRDIRVSTELGPLISQFPNDAVQALGWPRAGADGAARRAREFWGPRLAAGRKKKKKKRKC